MLSSTRKVPLREGTASSGHRGLLFCIAGFLIVVFPSIAFSQPTLTFKRVTVNWPTIELYFSVGCNGAPAYNMTKQDFTILENGKEVKDKTLWCPDPHMHAAISVALVFDASGSMRGSGAVGAKLAGRGFVDLLDGVVDEAAIIHAGALVTMPQAMTWVKPLLYAAIDTLPATGASALWDGVYGGIEELIRSGTNASRAVLVFTNGSDNSSKHTWQELVTLANRNRIRVFVITSGVCADSVDLEVLALLTGGKFLDALDNQTSLRIYSEIASVMYHGFQECIMVYERDCAAGDMRTVEIQLNNFCGGNAAKTKTYRAPLDSTTFSVQQLRVGRIASVPRDVVTVPLRLESVSNNYIDMLRPFDITVRAGHPGQALFDVTVPAGSPIFGAAVEIERFADSVRFRLKEEIALKKTGTLFEMHFFTSGILDTVFYPLTARVNPGDQSCVITTVESGGYQIFPQLKPRITPSGIVMHCREGVVELEANQGFLAYRWSTGDSTRRVTIANAGTYFVKTINELGDTLQSGTVEVRDWPERSVQLEASGPLSLCEGESVTFTVKGDTAKSSIFWMHAKSAHRSLFVRKATEVWATVVDEHGCRHYTDTAYVSIVDPPVTLNVPGDIVTICSGDSIELRVEEAYPFYLWKTGFNKYDSTRSITARASGGRLGQGDYSVMVRDSNGCQSRWHTMNVREYKSPRISITPAENIVLCSGAAVEVSVSELFASYRWSTGDTTRSITVRDAGQLIVEGITQEGCVSISDTLVVSIAAASSPPIVPVKYGSLCADDSVQLDAGGGYAQYQWSTGDTTRLISVGEPGSFHVDIMAHGGCWVRSDTFTVRPEIDGVPVISYQGSQTICPGDSLILEASEGYEQYIWSTHETTRSIVVHDGGRYAVSVFSSSGCEATSEIVFVWVRQPEDPYITRDGLTLSTTTHVLSHQWFLNGQSISGATGPVYDVTQTGRYTVQIVDSCGAVLLSNELLITTLGIATQPGKFSLDVYPDPSDGLIHVAIAGVRGIVQAELLDLLGRSIMRQRWSADSDGAVRETLTFRNAPRGLYLLRITHKDGVLVRRLIKE